MVKKVALHIIYIGLLLFHPAFSAPLFDERYLQWKAQQEAHDRRLVSEPTQSISGETARPSASNPQVQAAPTATASPLVATVTVHLNQANVQQLQQLKGVGEKKARAIVEYREQHGPFKKIEELKQVKGIGEGTFLKNQAQLAL